MPPEDRRPPFRNAPFEHGRGGRPNGPDHGGDRPQGDRPPFGAPRPFTRPPTRGGDLPAPPHSVRIRDGERELEVTGAPAFVRQILDDLPALLGRMRGEATGRTAISMPAPPPSASTLVPTAMPDSPGTSQTSDGSAENGQRADGAAPGSRRRRPTSLAGAPAVAEEALQDEVFAVLRRSPKPLAVAGIRDQLDADVTGQQVRRLLERAGTTIKVSGDRPATYSLR